MSFLHLQWYGIVEAVAGYWFRFAVFSPGGKMVFWNTDNGDIVGTRMVGSGIWSEDWCRMTLPSNALKD